MLRLERGGLGGKIPTEIGLLTNLFFLDIDFNHLTGSLPSELFSLGDLAHLDLNDNQLTGDIDGVCELSNLRVLQIHDNAFTGTVPVGLGQATELRVFTLQGNQLSGRMPRPICNLVDVGTLTDLVADCEVKGSGVRASLNCLCCTGCSVV